jgi:hypothetical protein
VEKLPYVSAAAGRDFWVTNEQKVQHVGTSGDFIFYANLFFSTHPVKKWALHSWEANKSDRFWFPKLPIFIAILYKHANFS